jgi:VCBS repeat-containing protein
MTLQPAGDAFRIFPETLIGDQSLGLPAAAVLSDGSYIVVTSSQGRDGSGYGISAQRFGAGGTPLTGEFQVNTTTAGDQTGASVISLADGFIVTWDSAGQDGSGSGVYAQRFDASGNKVGSELRISTTTTGDQHAAVVAPLPAGGFAIAWTSAGDIRAQLYDAQGNSLNGELLVSSSSTGLKDHPGIAPLQTGGFLVTWDSPDGSEAGVFGQIYDSLGQKVGDEFSVNTTTAGDQSQAHVTALPDGLLLATWIDHHAVVSAQFLSSTGAQVGAEFTISSEMSAVKAYPTAVPVGDDRIFVTWSSVDQDGSGSGVYGQILDLSGNPIGGELQVNSFSTGDQRQAANSAEIVLADGTVIATWASNGEDTGGFGAYAQRFGTPASNQPPTIDEPNSILAGTVSELASTTGSSALDRASGVIVFSDTDAADRPTASIAAQTVVYHDADGNTFDLSAAQIAAIEAAFTLAPEAGNGSAGKIDWSFSIPDDTLDFLQVGESVVLASTVQIDDHNDGTVHRNVTVTINGANDLPQASPDTAASDGSYTHTSTGMGAHDGHANDDHREWQEDDHDHEDGHDADEGLEPDADHEVCGSNGSRWHNDDDGHAAAPDTFTYTVVDAHGGTTISTLTIPGSSPASEDRRPPDDAFSCPVKESKWSTEWKDDEALHHSQATADQCGNPVHLLLSASHALHAHEFIHV